MEGTFVGSMPRVAVVGGSLGGLTAALLLRDLGCEVSVYERSHEELEAKGAGIAVLEATWRYPVQRLGVGVFVSALRDALTAGEIDFAVHSYKDLPTAAAPGLHVAAGPPAFSAP